MTSLCVARICFEKIHDVWGMLRATIRELTKLEQKHTSARSHSERNPIIL